MKNLVITAAGLSSRFEGLKPKWMLTHPSGDWMIVEALKELDLASIDKIYLGFLQEHIDKYDCRGAIDLCLKELGIEHKTEVVLLNKRTDNQPHTAYEVIKKSNIEGQVIIKEVDNKFSFDIIDGNFMTYYDLNMTTSINPSNKSYIEIDDEGLICNLIEKKVISSTFGCGCYSFEDSSLYCDYFEKLSDNKTLYLSDIIKKMVDDGHKFKPILVTDYVDWGTKEDWFNYIREYKTLFVDLDGTLVYSSGKYSKPFWGETEGIENNIKFLNKLYDSGKVYIIITTARSSEQKWKDATLNQLVREGIKYHDIIFNLPHCNRTIINDYGTSNPYPTCDSVNIVRNSNQLERFLKDLGI